MNANKNLFKTSGEEILKGMPHATVKHTVTKADEDTLALAKECREKRNAKRLANVKKGGIHAVI